VAPLVSGGGAVDGTYAAKRVAPTYAAIGASVTNTGDGWFPVGIARTWAAPGIALDTPSDSGCVAPAGVPALTPAGVPTLGSPRTDPTVPPDCPLAAALAGVLALLPDAAAPLPDAVAVLSWAIVCGLIPVPPAEPRRDTASTPATDD
jgi:hypothetical protein